MPNGNHSGPPPKKVIFLDIDGPLLPARAWVLPQNRDHVRSQLFDSIAVAFVNRLVDRSGGAIVISSTWRARGLAYITGCFESNGIPARHIHADWATPSPSAINDSRLMQIHAWLDKHTEITHYVCIDDIDLGIPECVLVTFQDGMLLDHYREATRILGCEDQFVVLG